jgi:hypothetical protein
MKTVLLVVVMVLRSAQVFAQERPLSFPYLIDDGFFFVNADSVRLRQEPGTASPVVAVLKKGTRVIPFATSQSRVALDGDKVFYWYRCELVEAEPRTGWVYGA